MGWYSPLAYSRWRCCIALTGKSAEDRLPAVNRSCGCAARAVYHRCWWCFWYRFLAYPQRRFWIPRILR
ncbi:hypothetical protein KCP69_11305 [Salmonella enterica subsp. enterica]|nr:hypothetical protein KCP69_11305 [Salmonella enterica subsp. enterica]